MKKSEWLLCAFYLISLSLTASAQSVAIKARAEVDLLQAQAWLASINIHKTAGQIKQIKKLVLDLYGTFNGISTQQLINNETLRHLQVIENLEELSLPRWINDTGLKNVKNLRNLKSLSISITNITDAGMEFLNNLNSLEKVYLHGTKVTGTGIKNLLGKQIVMLGLNQTGIGDADIETIGKLTSLQSLYLVGTKITDRSITHLKKLKNLRRIDIVGTKITLKGKQKLRKEIPGIQIY